jgi:hypothetical protein
MEGLDAGARQLPPAELLHCCVSTACWALPGYY